MFGFCRAAMRTIFGNGKIVAAKVKKAQVDAMQLEIYQVYQYGAAARGGSVVGRRQRIALAAKKVASNTHPPTGEILIRKQMSAPAAVDVASIRMAATAASTFPPANPIQSTAAVQTTVCQEAQL